MLGLLALCLANKVAVTALRCNLFSAEKAQKRPELRRGAYSAPKPSSWVSGEGKGMAERGK